MSTVWSIWFRACFEVRSGCRRAAKDLGGIWIGQLENSEWNSVL